MKNILLMKILFLIDRLIRTEKELEDIIVELSEEYTFDENTFSD